jgi:chemotaxis protein methyltransferase CheR
MLIEFDPAELTSLLEAIRSRYGFDLTGYSRASLQRRISRYMISNRVAGTAALREHLFSSRDIFEQFMEEITVNVTEMFRDPAFYRALRTEVLPLLKTYPHVRVWDAGCSTGEETYSLAILLGEEGLYNRTRIYATDVNRSVLSSAREGIYPLTHMRDYSRNYLNAGGKTSLSDYYTARYERAIMNQELSSRVLFSPHNLAQDQSFNEFHLVVCRNVLIYFNKALQEKVLALFVASIPVFGFLALGNKETLRFTKYENLFEVIDSKEKIYRRTK